MFTDSEDSISLTTVQVEVECTLARLLHDGKIDAQRAARLRHESKILIEKFSLVPPSATVIEAAIRLARAHPIDLRAGDALHLAAWQVVSGGDPSAVEFVCLDKRLKKSTLAQGATIVP